MSEERLHRQNIVACIWDFDNTLIPGYMQEPIFRHFDVDAKKFWKEVNALPAYFNERGQHVSPETCYLNHLLSYVRTGRFKGMNNKLLRELGKELVFFPGLPDFFATLCEVPRSRADFKRHEIIVEHYIISTGLAEMIRGSAIAPLVTDIYGCELVENPPPPGFTEQKELISPAPDDPCQNEVSQIGVMVDNTIKTRFIFEINKGSNRWHEVDVNAKMAPEDRRVPIENMIYVADGPSDVPVFSVVRGNKGKAFAVYDPENDASFAQNDEMRQQGRVDHFGEADYRPQSATHKWLKLQVTKICERIVREEEEMLSRKVSKPPQHLHRPEKPVQEQGGAVQGQSSLPFGQ
ncbi:MAG: haloacid dehalogenase-like hydrolase [Opitutales bacterium]|nr:haloacid dehalogenase-like hydrolase [Opitutales bacterium]